MEEENRTWNAQGLARFSKLFREAEDDLEGLIHISEMSWTQHIKHPSKIMSVNDNVEAVVLSVDKDNEKISLGIKQMSEDPWLHAIPEKTRWIRTI